MTENDSHPRRRFIAITACLGITSLAGCNNSTSETEKETLPESNSDDDSSIESGSGNRTHDDQNDQNDGSELNKNRETPTSVNTYLENVNNYDGTVVDEINNNSPKVMVGTQGDTADRLVFDPPAIEVSTGTEVTWEWRGSDQTHKIKHAGRLFESESADNGHTYALTIEREGVFLYHCDHHEEAGMRGAIVAYND